MTTPVSTALVESSKRDQVIDGSRRFPGEISHELYDQALASMSDESAVMQNFYRTMINKEKTSDDFPRVTQLNGSVEEAKAAAEAETDPVEKANALINIARFVRS